MPELLDDNQFDKCLNILKASVIRQESDLTKSLWRMSGGSRSKAFDIIKSTAIAYGVKLSYALFDELCAHYNGGIDIEWESE